MRKKKLNWKKIWKEFEKWYNAAELKARRCSNCGFTPCNPPRWNEQQKQIEVLVEQAMDDRN